MSEKEIEETRNDLVKDIEEFVDVVVGEWDKLLGFFTYHKVRRKKRSVYTISVTPLPATKP